MDKKINEINYLFDKLNSFEKYEGIYGKIFDYIKNSIELLYDSFQNLNEEQYKNNYNEIKAQLKLLDDIYENNNRYQFNSTLDFGIYAKYISKKLN